MTERIRRLFGPACAALVIAFLVSAQNAQAQGCGLGTACITVTPATDSVDLSAISAPTDTAVYIAIQIEICSDWDWHTLVIDYNGVSIIDSLSVMGVQCPYGAKYWGSVRLSKANEGYNYLSVSIEGLDQNQDPQFANGSGAFRYLWPGYTRPTFQVAVTAAALTLERRTDTTDVAAFTITNEGSRPASYRLTNACHSGIACAPDTTMVTLDTTSVGRTQTRQVSFSTNSTVRDDGAIVVRAAGAYRHDTTSYNAGAVDSARTDVFVRAVDPVGTPGLVLARRTDLVVPSLCVNVPAGRDGGNICGNLVLAHALPAVTTRNQLRAPMLIYNSDHARPTPIVAANLTLPNNGLTPDSVVARLWVNGGLVGTRSKWVDTSFAPGKTRRIAVAFDASAYATGVYPLMLETRRHHGGSVSADTVTSELVIVNRVNSPFGAGWWLAGMEQLVVVSATKLLWVGGDGAARVFIGASGAGPWIGAALAGPDTITKVTGSGTWYERRLAAGAKIRFNGNGLHFETVSRLGDVTRFRQDTTVSPVRLTSIQVPLWPKNDTYQFRYDGNFKLDTVVAPGPETTASDTMRVTRVFVSSANVDSIVDPDGTKVEFVYGSSATARRVVTRTNRLGVATHFRYDAGNRLAADSLAAGGSLPHAIVNRVTMAESRGVDMLTKINPPDSAYTLFNASRTDVADETRFWVNALGAPTRIRNAHGRETRLRYHATFPALADSVAMPTGAWTRAKYNSRGLVDTIWTANLRSVGDSLAITAMRWHHTLPMPDTVIVANGRDTTIAAYLANGNLRWRQRGSSATRRDSVFYHASGAAADLYRFSRLPGVDTTHADTVLYDARANAVTMFDRRGYKSQVDRDALGRVVRSRVRHSATDTLYRVDSTFYDLMGRVVRQHAFGPGYVFSAGTVFDTLSFNEATMRLHVVTEYDSEGRAESISRTADPDPADLNAVTATFSYDAAGRVVEEGGDGGGDKTYSYDPAGHVVRLQVGGAVDVANVYDAAGQLVRRTTPARAYSGLSCTFFVPGSCAFAFPLSTGGTAALTIPGDTATFAYDRGGRLTRADNAAARVRRGWSPGGLLLADTAYVRTLKYATEGAPLPATDFANHRYILAYNYDLAGRRTKLWHPSQLLPTGVTAAQQYGYATGTGALSTVTDVLGGAFQFTYTPSGQLAALRAPNGVLDTMIYDPDGMVERRRLNLNATDVLLADTLTRDPQGRLLTFAGIRFVDGAGTSVTNTYAGFGALTSTVTLSPDREEYFLPDAHGNVVRSGRHGVELGNDVDDPAYRLHLYGMAGRLLAVEGPNPSTAHYYADRRDVAGPVEWRDGYQGIQQQKSDIGLNRWTQAAHYYDGFGRLAVFERHVGNFSQGSAPDDPAGVIERYRYDALGRRVLVHTDRLQSCSVAGCDRSVRRTIWDGDQTLYEIRALATSAESDAPSGHGLGSAQNQFGRIGYMHAFGVDRPLAAVRMSGNSILVTFYPHVNWRGLFEGATRPDTSLMDNDVTWPGVAASAYLGTPSDGAQEWMGSLVIEQADASGLLYRRNRYYDPMGGQFTQPDPIGLAGGLNLYGYANGDPINFSDPFGLCPEEQRDANGDCPGLNGAEAAAVFAGLASFSRSLLRSDLRIVGQGRPRGGIALEVSGSLRLDGAMSACAQAVATTRSTATARVEARLEVRPEPTEGSSTATVSQRIAGGPVPGTSVSGTQTIAVSPDGSSQTTRVGVGVSAGPPASPTNVSTPVPGTRRCASTGGYR